MNCCECGEEIREPVGYICDKCMDAPTELKELQKAGVLPLSPREAIIAMMDGVTLIDPNGIQVRWNATENTFVYTDTNQPLGGFTHLHFKKTRPMTRFEILAWAQSPESRGWLVNVRYYGSADLEDDWQLPSQYKYDDREGRVDEVFAYVRAPLLPDNSGVDETRMENFEIEA